MDATQGLGFGHFLGQADIVAKPILVIMLLASITSGYLFITKLNRAAVLQKFDDAAQSDPASEPHLHADQNTRREAIADMMSEAGKAGLSKIGFVTDPSQIAPLP
jgi:biopolymer transport protein ExbD